MATVSIVRARCRRRSHRGYRATNGRERSAGQLLRPERRAVVVLRYWADLPHGETAEILDCPIATVRTRLHRVLADLRKEVNR